MKLIKKIARLFNHLILQLCFRQQLTEKTRPSNYQPDGFLICNRISVYSDQLAPVTLLEILSRLESLSVSLKHHISPWWERNVTSPKCKAPER